MTNHEIAVDYVRLKNVQRVTIGLPAYSKEKEAELVKIQEWVIDSVEAHSKQLQEIIDDCR
jgi:hypothetical protein